MDSQVDHFKTAFIKERVAELQKTDRRLTFRQAWDKVQREHPDLFRSAGDSSYAPKPDKEPERTWDQQSLPPSLSQLKAAADNLAFLDLLALSRQMRLPIRVEASRGEGPALLELSQEHGALLCAYAEALGFCVEQV